MPIKNKKNSSQLDESVSQQVNKSNLYRKNDLPEPEEDEIVTFKMPRNYKEMLSNHFKGEGLNLSNGIRRILYEYINRNCL